MRHWTSKYQAPIISLVVVVVVVVGEVRGHEKKLWRVIDFDFPAAPPSSGGMMGRREDGRAAPFWAGAAAAAAMEYGAVPATGVLLPPFCARLSTHPSGFCNVFLVLAPVR